MAKRKTARSVDAKSRLVYTNGGFVLVIDRFAWPKWLQEEREIRITEIIPKSKKGKKPCRQSK